jgi:hypothetical protein
MTAQFYEDLLLTSHISYQRGLCCEARHPQSASHVEDANFEHFHLWI